MKHNPHPGLGPLVDAAKSLSPRVAIVFAHRFAVLAPYIRLSNPFARLVEYAELGYRVFGARRADLIVVREFSTLYFVPIALLLFPLMRKSALLVAHNVQSARRRKLEARLLNLYCALGARLICLETRAGAEGVIKPKYMARVATLPHPVSGQRSAEARTGTGPDASDAFTIAVVGNLRPEKGGLSGLAHLSAAASRLDGAIELVLGSPNALDLGGLPEKFKRVSTRTREDYLRVLKTSHVVVLSYPAANYEFRASGVIADAIGCGTPVITMDLPVVSSQVREPAVTGVCLKAQDFENPEKLAAALEEIRANWASYQVATRLNAEGRTEQALARQLATLLA